MQYALDMCATADPFERQDQLDAAVVEARAWLAWAGGAVVCLRCMRCAQAIEWQAARSPAEVMQQREEMISQIELANTVLWESGKCEHWFRNCDPIIQKVSEGVNGYLLQELLTASHHCDVAAVELFRTGRLVARVVCRVCKGLCRDVLCRCSHAGRTGTQRRGCTRVR